MQVRNREDQSDLLAALEVRDRAWRVGFRGVVEDDVVEDALLEPGEGDTVAFSETLDSEAGAFLVADGEDGVVGYVRVRWASTPPFVDAMEAEIVELFVDPARWRRGVGTALLAKGLEWTPDTLDGVATAVVETNHRARSFLEASGFGHDGATETELGGHELDAAIYRAAFEEP